MSEIKQAPIEGKAGEAAAHAAVIAATTAPSGKLTLLEKALIKADQDGIRVSLIKLDASIHSNAVQCLLHAEKHGDTSLMRRLLVDIIDAKSGYRRQGIIAWMREFSPMELKGDVISLSGTINGEKRPFRCEEANKTPFTQLASAREMVPMKPIYRQGVVGKLERALKEYRAAVENTIIEPGKPPAPKDVKKPFYDGIHLDKMEKAFDQVDTIVADISSWGDDTEAARTAAENLKKAELAMAEQAKN